MSPIVRVTANLVWQGKWQIGLLAALYVLIGALSFLGFVYEGPTKLNSLWSMLELVTAWAFMRIAIDDAVIRILKSSPLTGLQRARILWWFSCGSLIAVVLGTLSPLALWFALQLTRRPLSTLPIVIRDWTIHSLSGIAYLSMGFLLTKRLAASANELLKKLHIANHLRSVAMVLFSLVLLTALLALFAANARTLYAIEPLRYSVAALSVLGIAVLYARPLPLARLVESLSLGSARRLDRETAEQLERMTIRLDIARFKPLPVNVVGWRVALHSVVRAVYQSCVGVAIASTIIFFISKDRTWFYAIGSIMIAGAGLPIVCEYVGSWRTLRALPVSVDKLTLVVFSLFAVPLVGSWAAAFFFNLLEPYGTKRWALLVLVSGTQFLSVPLALRFAHKRKLIALWTIMPMFAFASFVVSLPAPLDPTLCSAIFLAEMTIAYLTTRRILQTGRFFAHPPPKPSGA